MKLSNIIMVILLLMVVGMGAYIYISNFGPTADPPIPGTDPLESREPEPVDTPIVESTADVEDLTGISENTSVTFYEGNGCSQDKVHTVGTSNFSGKPSHNDEARSVLLKFVPKGTVIKIYDNPDGKTDDDYTTMTVVARIIDYCVRTFEESRYTSSIEITYNRKNGLDGKVSRISVQYP